MRETKALTGVEIKDADKGKVTAVFSTFDVIDLDGDVTVPGAFEDGAAVRISAYGHASWGGALPIGKGTIRQTETEAILDGRFFLDTEAGRETFATVKGMGDLQEWSYGYDPVEADRGQFEDQDVRFLRKLKVNEVSPVLLGAGVNTRTLAVKGDPPPTSFSDDAKRALASVQEFVARARSLAELRAKEGRVLSAANRERLSDLLVAFGESGAELDRLLAESDPDKHRTALLSEIARYERLRRVI